MSTEVARIAVSTMAEQMEFARMVTAQPDRGAQSILPEAYRGNPANVLIAVGLGQSMGLSQAESLYRIAVIKGKPTAAAELISSNVRKAGHRLRITDGDATTTASIWRADDPEFEFRVTRDLKWAKEMGLAGNDNYKKQLLTMLQWRAISAVARLACPEALYGVAYVAEEIGDYGNGDAPKRVTADEITKPRAASTSKVDEPVDAEIVDDTPPSSDLIDPKSKQMAALHAALNEGGLGDRDAGLKYISELLGHDVGSTRELTVRDASRVIDAVKALAENPLVADEVPLPDTEEPPWE